MTVRKDPDTPPAGNRVDFYILSQDAPDAVPRTVCRLVEKAWRQGHRVYVHADSPAMAAELDRWLWTFRQDSFVPHEPYRGEEPDPLTPILIGFADAPPVGFNDVLVNLSHRAPPFSTRFQRTAEVIPLDPVARQAGRARYVQYREQGAHIQSHEL